MFVSPEHLRRGVLVGALLLSCGVGPPSTATRRQGAGCPAHSQRTGTRRRWSGVSDKSSRTWAISIGASGSGGGYIFRLANQGRSYGASRVSECGGTPQQLLKNFWTERLVVYDDHLFFRSYFDHYMIERIGFDAASGTIWLCPRGSTSEIIQRSRSSGLEILG